jgi:DNA polymerase-3 subunit epsilon
MKYIEYFISVIIFISLYRYPLTWIITAAIIGISIYVNVKKKKEAEAKEAERIRYEKEQAEKNKLIQQRIKESWDECLKYYLRNPIFIDTETTGLSKNGRDELLEVSIINGFGEVLFNQYIKPDNRKSWPRAEEVNGITPEMVKDCKPFSSYLEEVQNIFDEATCVIGYNTEFDMTFLENEGIKSDKFVFDVMRDYAAYRDPGNHQKWYKLTACAKYFDYKWDKGKAHDSLADANATLYCFKKLFAADAYANRPYYSDDLLEEDV